MMSAVD